MTEFRAYGNRILVEEEPPEKRTIQLPEGTRINPVITGKVVSVGPGVMTAHGWDTPQVKLGDRVAWMRGQGFPFPPGGEHCVCLWAGEVVAVERDADVPQRKKLVESELGTRSSVRLADHMRVMEQANPS